MHINRAFHIYEYLQGGSKVVEKFFMLSNITALLVGLVALWPNSLRSLQDILCVVLEPFVG